MVLPLSIISGLTSSSTPPAPAAPLSVTLFSHPWIASLHPLGMSWDVTSSGEIFPELTTPTISLNHSPSLITITTLCCFPHSFSYHYQQTFSFLNFGIFISLVQKYLLSSLTRLLSVWGIKRPHPMDIKFGHVTSLSKEMCSEENC